MSFTIVGKRMSLPEFRAYVAGVTLTNAFQPTFVVVHNTASPNLAQRPQGLTYQHILNLQSYYEGLGWHGGPHVFVDDLGVWVFNPLDRAGVHSPSWNHVAWGMEMLGDYDSDSPTTGRGRTVIANGAAVVAILLGKLGYDADNDSIKFHYEDKATTHACPGKLLKKPYFVGLVQAVMGQTPPSTPPPPPPPALPSGWTVKDADGAVVLSGVPAGPQGTGLVRSSVEAVGGVVDVDGQTRTITVYRPAGAAPPSSATT